MKLNLQKKNTIYILLLAFALVLCYVFAVYQLDPRIQDSYMSEDMCMHGGYDEMHGILEVQCTRINTLLGPRWLRELPFYPKGPNMNLLVN